MVSTISSLIMIAAVTVPAHPVPDGVVFRGIQVVVRPDRIEVRYQLGLNEAMVRAELSERFGVGRSSDSDAAKDLLEFRDRMFSELPREMTLALGDRPCSLQLHRADVVMQQHAQVEFVYHVAVKATQRPQRFRLQDNNYPDVPGFHLMAVKGRGNVDVLQQGSSGESMLTRMQEALSEDGVIPLETPPMRQIEAYFALPATYEAPGGEVSGDSEVAVQNDTSVDVAPAEDGAPDDQISRASEVGRPAKAKSGDEANTGGQFSLPMFVYLIPLAVFAIIALAGAIRRLGKLA